MYKIYIYVFYVLFVLYKFFIEKVLLNYIYSVGLFTFSNADYLIRDKINNIKFVSLIIFICTNIVLFLFSLIEYLNYKKNIDKVIFVLTGLVFLLILYGSIPFFNGYM